ncbi:esterase/lipase family protein [Aeromicrobium sp. CTD01-1L150]|uniref:esterase/lipase family protein n=1 Tax=Aeromicrobium sp. CTD01-1L150 TaxID=3341830 RepID=UPI0035C0B75E
MSSSRIPVHAVIAAFAATLLMGLITPAHADSESYAPVDRPGPPLSVSEHDLDAALTCHGDLDGPHDVALFVAGTTMTPQENFSWNWFRAMDQLERPYCGVTVPAKGMGDIAVSAEYVVHAIRTIHERTGRQVDVLGHSQGGMSPRFALRFWPDLRAMVDDYVGFAPSNRGGVVVDAMCLPVVGCSPALHQQTFDSAFTQAVNSHQETFEGISYTVIYTRLDEFIQPNLDDTGSSSLRTGDGEITNVALQDVCPVNVTEHLLVGTADPVAHALAMDALDHPGPADPARVPPAVCTRAFMPGVDPATFATDFAGTTAKVAEQLLLARRVARHPDLPAYVFAERG